MAKPTDIQQARSKKRIKQLIETRPVGRSVRKEKLRIGKLVGYTGEEANIIRSVNRLITPQTSKQTRNLRSKEQVRKIDRSWRDRIKKEKGKDFQIPITEWVKPIILKSDFKDDDFDVWLPGAIQGIGQIIFSKPRGIIRGYYLRFTNDDDFERGEPIHSLGFQLPLGSTFGYLENGMKDLYNIWNKRIRLLFENQSYPITKAIFSPFVPEAIELINNEVEKVVELPGLEMGYYINYQIEQSRRDQENA
mgnify:FL=1|tara:strand:- start:767 stop:1513 length:747 start_codon:yes stop_codon:yes gene_type:complete